MGPEGPTQLRNVLLRAESAEGGVRSNLVVVLAPLGAEVAGVLNAPEAVRVEELVRTRPLKLSASAFSTGSPGRMKWCSMPWASAQAFRAPGVQGPGGELRPVVRADSAGLAVLPDGVIEHSSHALCRHRNVALEGDAAPREVVDAGEHSNRSCGSPRLRATSSLDSRVPRCPAQGVATAG